MVEQMSALGQKQTLGRRPLMSAIHPKADVDEYSPNVRFVPKADIGHFIQLSDRR
jgi:hypothetical protein